MILQYLFMFYYLNFDIFWCTTLGAKEGKNQKMLTCIKNVDLHKQNHILSYSFKNIFWSFKQSIKV